MAKNPTQKESPVKKRKEVSPKKKATPKKVVKKASPKKKATPVKKKAAPAKKVPAKSPPQKKVTAVTSTRSSSSAAAASCLRVKIDESPETVIDKNRVLGKGGFGTVSLVEFIDPEITGNSLPVLAALKVQLLKKKKKPAQGKGKGKKKQPAANPNPNELGELTETTFWTEVLTMIMASNVAIYAASWDPEEGEAIIYQEYIPGVNGDTLIGKATWSQALAMFAGMLWALQRAHSQSVYHRDVKPQNIIITSEGANRLIDYGTGCTQHDFKFGSKHSQLCSEAEMFVHTPFYASPWFFRLINEGPRQREIKLFEKTCPPSSVQKGRDMGLALILARNDLWQAASGIYHLLTNDTYKIDATIAQNHPEREARAHQLLRDSLIKPPKLKSNPDPPSPTQIDRFMEILLNALDENQMCLTVDQVLSDLLNSGDDEMKSITEEQGEMFTAALPRYC